MGVMRDFNLEEVDFEIKEKGSCQNCVPQYERIESGAIFC